MPSVEEYRQRAKEAGNQANSCCNEWERQGFLIIADQYERLAAYKDLMARSFPVTALAQDDIKVAIRGAAKDSNLPNLLDAKSQGLFE
jgi:hypothetical protein